MIFLLGSGQYAHYWPTKGTVRLFLAALFFFGLHINTAYHSFLITVLTNPRYNEQINTVEMGIDAGIIFQVAESTVEFFEKEDAVSKSDGKPKVFSNHNFHRYRNTCCGTMKFVKTWMNALRKFHQTIQKYWQFQERTPSTTHSE